MIENNIQCVQPCFFLTLMRENLHTAETRPCQCVTLGLGIAYDFPLTGQGKKDTAGEQPEKPSS